MIFAKPWLDAIIVLLVVLLFFGPKRLPALGKSLGEGMREFKDSITGGGDSDEESDQAGLNQTASVPPAAATPPPAQPAPPAAQQAAPAAPPVAPEASPVSPVPSSPPASTSPEPESAPVASSEHSS
jgi:sec-independent protein translocase protein TatA